MAKKKKKWVYRVKEPFMSRGDYGVCVERVHRVIWDPMINGWRKANGRDPYHLTWWGFFDPDWGWFPIFRPEDFGLPADR